MIDKALGHSGFSAESLQVQGFLPLVLYWEAVPSNGRCAKQASPLQPLLLSRDLELRLLQIQRLKPQAEFRAIPNREEVCRYQHGLSSRLLSLLGPQRKLIKIQPKMKFFEIMGLGMFLPKVLETVYIALSVEHTRKSWRHVWKIFLPVIPKV